MAKKKSKDKVLNIYKAEKLISSNIDVAKSTLVKDLVKEADGVNKFTEKYGFPVVLKVVSDEALHKSDLGGVSIAYNQRDLESKWGDMEKNLKKHKIKYEGILIQQFIEGEQIFIGISNDEAFGHVIGVGIGGVAVEALKDVQFRKCPVSEEDAESMLQNLKMSGLLYSERRKLAVDALKSSIVSVSKLPQKVKNIQELDINPVILNNKDCVAVDARVVLG